MGLAQGVFDQWEYQEQAKLADQIAADLRSQEPLYMPPVYQPSPLLGPVGSGETATGGVANPYGGFTEPTPTYTPHTGTTGEGEFKQGTGGGQEIIRPPAPIHERILARPDLQRARRPTQFALGAPIGRVTPVTNQNPLSSALREGGQ